MSEINHTADLGELKFYLISETNKKSEYWKLLIEYGDALSKTQQEVLKAKNLYMQIKTQIKCCEDRIKTLKTTIRSEGQFGG